jgi:hypothetical protein
MSSKLLAQAHPQLPLDSSLTFLMTMVEDGDGVVGADLQTLRAVFGNGSAPVKLSASPLLIAQVPEADNVLMIASTEELALSISLAAESAKWAGPT